MKALCALILSGLFWGNASQAATISLEEGGLADRIRQNNGAVQAAERALEAIQNQSGYWRRSYYPALSAEAGGEAFRTGPYESQEQPFGGVNATLNLYRGGRDRLEDRRIESEIQRAQTAYEQTVAEQLLQARELFWTLVYQQELFRILQDALQENEGMLGSAKKRIQGGLATDTDRLEFEMNRTQLEQDRARVRMEGHRAERHLKAVLGLMEADTLQTPVAVPHEHDDAFSSIRWDPSSHRDIRVLDAQRRVTHLQRRDSLSWWKPSLDLYGDYSLYTFREREYAERRDRDEIVGGAKVSMSLFDRGQSRVRTQALAREADSQLKQRDQIMRLLRSDFASLQEELHMLHDLIHSAEQGAAQGKNYLQLTRSEYARGVKNSPDVLSAFQKYLELQRRYADIRRDYQLIKNKLRSVMER